MKITVRKLLLSMITLLLVSACTNPNTIDSHNHLSSPSPQQQNDAELPATALPTSPSQKPLEVIQEPFLLPQGYQIAETATFQFAIPQEWTFKESSSSDILIFTKVKQELGQTELLGWFDSATWKDMKPNHSEQVEFQEIEGLIPISGVDVHTYKIQLTHTKPAAEQDQDWEFKETRWYVAIKEQELAYGFYFSSNDVDEAIMKTIVSTFRLKL